MIYSAISSDTRHTHHLFTIYYHMQLSKEVPLARLLWGASLPSILALTNFFFHSRLITRLQYNMIKQESLVGLKIKQYTFLRPIGDGNYGRVYEVVIDGVAESAAAKVIPKDLLKEKPKLLELAKSEIKVLKECHNQNVVRYVDNFMTERSIVIVMEYCEGGELQTYLNNKGRLTENEATAFLKQILNGFKGLHQVSAMHRDFKAANVLLRHGVCKIADLGFTKQVKEEGLTKTILGTGLTMAPEVHQEKAYGRKADLWSVGVVFYQLIYGDYPFKGYSDHDILLSIKNKRPDFSKVNISPKARDFIDRCLTINPKERISWAEVYSHPLITEEDKIMYGVSASHIRIGDNKVFYDRDSIPEEKEEVTKGQEWTKGEQEAVEQAVLQSLRAQHQQMGRSQQAVKEWQAEYVARRNGYMFIFREMVPCMLRIYKHVHANHIITLFILCKRAYHELSIFAKQLANGENFTGKTAYFTLFLTSKQYKELREQVESDIALIRMQTHQYCLNLPTSLNQATKQELDLDVIASSNWPAFVEEAVSGYEDELVGEFDSIPAAFKQDTIKLVEGLYYYRTHGDRARMEEFDKYMENQSYQEAEVRLRERWIKKVTQCQQ